MKKRLIIVQEYHKKLVGNQIRKINFLKEDQYPIFHPRKDQYETWLLCQMKQIQVNEK